MLGAVLATFVMLHSAAGSDAPDPLVVLDTLGELPPPSMVYHCKSMVILVIADDGSLRIEPTTEMGVSWPRVDLPFERVPAELRRRLSKTPGCDTIYVMANEDAPFVEIQKVLVFLHQSGFQRVALMATSGVRPN